MSESKFDELLKELNAAEIIQTAGDWEENIPQDIWEKYFKKNPYEEQASGINPDTHRWYEISTTVVKIFDRFLGIKYITKLFSESGGFEDCYVSMKFTEMDEIMQISYIDKYANRPTK